MGCRALSDSEYVAILPKFVCLRDHLLFVLGNATGFRISELLSLKVSDVFAFGKALARVQVDRSNMKGKRRSRSVSLTETVRNLIEQYCSSMNPDDLLFDISRVHAWRILTKAFASAGVAGNVATHSMRKTFAKKIYANAKGDIYKTQQALGHSSIQSTIKYLESVQTEIDDLVLGISFEKK